MRIHMQSSLTKTRRRRNGGFSLIEVLFAIGMLGIGIVGILSLFTTGLSAAAWAGNMTNAAMEAQSLYTRIISETDAQNKRVFLNRINDPSNPTAADPDNEWIHNDTNNITPTLIDLNIVPSGEERELYWQCRVTKFPMDPEDALNPAKDGNNKGLPKLPNGLYQIAIAVYRKY